MQYPQKLESSCKPINFDHISGKSQTFFLILAFFQCTLEENVLFWLTLNPLVFLTRGFFLQIELSIEKTLPNLYNTQYCFRKNAVVSSPITSIGLNAMVKKFEKNPSITNVDLHQLSRVVFQHRIPLNYAIFQKY